MHPKENMAEMVEKPLNKGNESTLVKIILNLENVDGEPVCVSHHQLFEDIQMWMPGEKVDLNF